MFEITAEDIALLDDENLRALVGRLCESEMRRRGISTACVTWGGSQIAADGGVDVRVMLPPGVSAEGFIPRPSTVFQVKAEEIPPSEIESEMRPKAVLRQAIKNLAATSGAYIIVSSKSSTSDLAIEKRQQAMVEAVAELPDASKLKLDFYDRRRLETWLRDHVGTGLWVRERIGKPIPGWSGYGAWSYSPSGIESEYLVDGEIRIRTGREQSKPGRSVADGINEIRNILRNPRGIVRLVGLSGFGKTRLVQALFDERVGEQNLDPDFAAYTNLADGPTPQPTALASQLIAERSRAVLIIDNCPPDLHRRLAEICRAGQSLLSLITVEYDIREDQPEGTEVFVLESASTILTETLIRGRFPQLSQLDAKRIAEFSGGNARMAIALAGSVGKSESIAQLSDQDLFRRLFQQRNEPDVALFTAGQMLSLVYSFEGEDVSKDGQSELSALGDLIGESAEEMFRFAAALERRSLVQRRSRWRSVLPHGIANLLASAALQNLPAASISDAFLKAGRERLLKSFSRRLGYLNDSREARSLAAAWLSPDGLLRGLPDLDELGQSILNNVAPIVPEETLTALERALQRQTGSEGAKRFKPYVRLLRNLAYEAPLFGRCAKFIAEIALAEDLDNQQDDSQRAFASLFPVLYSGTHATIDQRLDVTRAYLLSADIKKRTLGLAALKALLLTADYSAFWDFDFGARSRNYGYWPRTREDVKTWFGRTLTFAEQVACSNEPAAQKVREVIAEQFRGLWGAAAMHEEVERTCTAIAGRGFWKEGWVALRQTIHFDAKGFDPLIAQRLAALEELLRPKDLIERVRAIVLSGGLHIAGLDSSDDQTADIPYDKVEEAAEGLGVEVASDEPTFVQLLPELGGNHEQLWRFGKGLAVATRGTLWEQLVSAFARSDGKGSVRLLHGFLNGLKESDAELANRFLDDAVRDDRIAFAYPVLQTAVEIGEGGVQRLLESLDLGKAPIQNYHSLVAGGVTHSITNEGFRRLLLRIAGKPDGLSIALEIFHMRLAFGRGNARSSRSELIDLGCDLIRKLKFGRGGEQLESYRLNQVVGVCLEGPRALEIVRETCRNLKDAVLKYETYAFQQKDLLDVMMTAQPLAVLDSLCGGGDADLRSGMVVLEGAAQMGRNPFDLIPEADLLAWCEQKPDSRYPAIAEGVTAFRFEGDRPHWTVTARELLDKAPDRVAVLKQFIAGFTPTGWTRSRAAIVESNTRLLDDLATYQDAALTEFIAAEKARLVTAIQEEREMQFLFDRERDERFE